MINELEQVNIATADNLTSDQKVYHTFHIDPELRQKAYEINLRLQAERDGAKAATGRMRRTLKPPAPEDAPEPAPHERAPKWRYRVNDHAGWIYVIQSGAEYKIGSSTNVSRRLRVLMAELACESHLVFKFRVDAMYSHECKLHETFADKRTRGEWFALTPMDLDTIQTMLELAA